MARFRTMTDLNEIESYFNRPEPVNPEAIIVDNKLVAIKIAGLRISPSKRGDELIVSLEEK